MNGKQLHILAAISAINARVAGMIAYNASCMTSGSDMLYGEISFLEAANDLEQLASEASHLAEAERA